MNALRILTLTTLGLFCACGASESGPRTVEITGNDQMQFNKRSFKAKVGEEVTIKFSNVGKMPVETMGHNLVILKPNSKTAEFGAASATAKDSGYIPESMKDKIIVHTKLLGPGESDTITFKPTAAGQYPFLCSFPGHYPTMNGQITVSN